MGVFKDPKNPDGMVLGMESGRLTVKHVLQMIQKFEESEVIFILGEVTEQLLLLKNSGVCNRDIKPENIILIEEKGRFLFKISDFGAGCVIEPKEANMIPAEDLTACSSKYAAPEILNIMEDEGPEQYDPYKGDVFSLALSFMEMLGHKTNREGFNRPEYIVNDLLQKMLLTNPNERISLKELSISLKKLISSNSDIAPSLFEKMRKVLDSWDQFQSDQQSKVSLDNFITSSLSNAKAYFDIFQFELSLKYLEKCEEKFKTEQKNVNLDLQAQVYYELGRVQNILSDYKKCEEYYKRSLEIRERVFGENHAATAQSLNNLGLFYKDVKGDLVLAGQFITKALQIRKKIFGQAHQDLANSFISYGIWLKASKHDRKSYFEALEYFRMGLYIFKEIYGEDNREVATAYNLMGCLFMENLQDFQEAEKHMRKSLEINLRIFGEVSLSIAICYNNLANVYNKNKDFPKAEEFYKRGLQIFIEICGQEHRDVATLYDNIGVFYQEIGNLAKAEDLLGKSLKIRLQKLGENHPETGTSYNNLASFYNHEEKRDTNKALEFYLKSLEIRVNVFGIEHPEVAKSFNDLGVFYKGIGDYNEAEKYYLKSLQIRTNSFGEYHMDVAGSLNNLGTFYSQVRKNFKQAEQCYSRRIRILETLYEPNDPYLAQEYEWFSKFCRSELEEAEKEDEYSDKPTYICKERCKKASKRG